MVSFSDFRLTYIATNNCEKYVFVNVDRGCGRFELLFDTLRLNSRLVVEEEPIDEKHECRDEINWLSENKKISQEQEELIYWISITW